MIIRIVKMTFKEDKSEDFVLLFNRIKHQIGNFEGVEKLELLRSTSNENIFFTYSYWTSETALEKYRDSQVFKSIWKETKAMFSERAEAWSTKLFDQY